MRKTPCLRYLQTLRRHPSDGAVAVGFPLITLQMYTSRLGLDAALHSEDKQIELNTLRRSLTAAQSGMLINDEIAGAARGGAELINS